MSGLVLENITKRYGRRVAVDALSLSVRPGEIRGFVGSNGAGKSTTMRIAMGLLAADAGTVIWNDAPADPGRTATFGYMPEERGLYPKMTVASQLVYLARLHGAGRAAAEAAMRRWTERLRIAEYRARSVEELSLGNQQRVQLAASLVHDPALLILDEPFSGLDPLAVDDMSGVLRETAGRGAPVLFSSHQLDLVERLCDRVGVIARGNLVADGTVAELSASAPGWHIETEGAPADWPARVPAVASWQPARAGADDAALLSAVTVVPVPGADGPDILRAAAEAGRVHAYYPRRRTLTETFLDLVAAGEQPTAQDQPCSDDSATGATETTGPARRPRGGEGA